MAYSNTSSAYDLSVYENVPKARQKKQVELKVVKNQKRRYATLASFLSPRVFSSFAIVVTLVCLIVYNQARLTEITGEIDTLNRELTQMQSQYAVMESQLATTVAMRNIEERAQQELGMQKLDKYQTEYVSLYEEDKIEITMEAPKDGVLSQAKLAVNSAINALKEYMNAD